MKALFVYFNKSKSATFDTITILRSMNENSNRVINLSYIVHKY